MNGWFASSLHSVRSSYTSRSFSIGIVIDVRDLEERIDLN